MINFTENDKRVIAETAAMIVAGSIDLIEGCRVIAHQLYAYTDRSDEVLNLFVAIGSETDDLPLGEVRKHWSPKALVQKDVEKDKYAQRIRQDVIKACRILVERYR